MERRVMAVALTFWCSGCMRQRERVMMLDVTRPAHINVFGLLCARCNERELTKPLPQADGTAWDNADEGGDDSGPLVSV